VKQQLKEYNTICKKLGSKMHDLIKYKDYHKESVTFKKIKSFVESSSITFGHLKHKSLECNFD
jgi:hypothetical protein